MCKLFSHRHARASCPTRCLRSSAATATSRTAPYGPAERLYRDCRAMWLEEGAPTVQRITIARELEKHNGRIEYDDWIAGTNLD